MILHKLALQSCQELKTKIQQKISLLSLAYFLRKRKETFEKFIGQKRAADFEIEQRDTF